LARKGNEKTILLKTGFRFPNLAAPSPLRMHLLRRVVERRVPKEVGGRGGRAAVEKQLDHLLVTVLSREVKRGVPPLGTHREARDQCREGAWCHESGGDNEAALGLSH